LRIVLTNLFGNAWKFTAKQPHARIEFGCSGENGGKEYFMRDNGAGFDQAYSSKLFGAFQRLHAAKRFPGNGNWPGDRSTHHPAPGRPGMGRRESRARRNVSFHAVKHAKSNAGGLILRAPR
jgi:hypothetical protein